MNLPTVTEVPLRQGAHDVMLVGNTRVPLDTVIWWFNQGETPEYIVQHFTTLNLADVYAVIAYYLRNREEVDEYIRKGQEASNHIRAEVEARQPIVDLRARLLARRSENR